MYTKITKGQARKLFAKGNEIYLHTNKLRYDNQWQSPALQSNANGSTFDQLVNAYAYYNCDNERGNVVIYLILQNTSPRTP